MPQLRSMRYLLNDTACLIYESARAGDDLDTIMDRLRTEFDAPQEARADVELFLTDLRQASLLPNDPESPQI